LRYALKVAMTHSHRPLSGGLALDRANGAGAVFWPGLVLNPDYVTTNQGEPPATPLR